MSIFKISKDIPRGPAHGDPAEGIVFRSPNKLNLPRQLLSSQFPDLARAMPVQLGEKSRGILDSYRLLQRIKNIIGYAALGISHAQRISSAAGGVPAAQIYSPFVRGRQVEMIRGRAAVLGD